MATLADLSMRDARAPGTTSSAPDVPQGENIQTLTRGNKHPASLAATRARPEHRSPGRRAAEEMAIAPTTLLRRSELWRSAPRRHVLEIPDHQIDLAVGHLVRRKAGHLLAGPIANRFRVADQRA